MAVHPTWHITSEDRVALEGALDRETVPVLWREIRQWHPKSDQVQVDLAQIDRIDSAGMVMLLHLIEHAKKRNCHIMLGFVPDQLMTLMRLSNVESILADHINNAA